MKLIAIPTRDGIVDDHFGHCAYYTEGCVCKSNIASGMQEMGITLMLAGNMGILESCDHHDCDHHQEKPVYFVPSFGK